MRQLQRLSDNFIDLFPGGTINHQVSFLAGGGREDRTDDAIAQVRDMRLARGQPFGVMPGVKKDG